MRNRSYIPNAFWIKKLHSLMGLWLVLFLGEHLLTNSQAALFWGDDGHGFVKLVNTIQELPYLKTVELTLIGFPIVIHALWGLMVLKTFKSNVKMGNHTKPELGDFGRNRAYSWQRITSWILLIGIIGHVIQMRFIDYPVEATHNGNKQYMVRLHIDKGLYILASRWRVLLFDKKQIDDVAAKVSAIKLSVADGIGDVPDSYNPEVEKELIAEDYVALEEEWVQALQKRPLESREVIASAPSFGIASLLIVRDTFKEPFMIGLYTLFVLAAVYHAFNGLWTFMISFGFTITTRSQSLMLTFCKGLMVLIAFLGLSAIFGSYLLG